MRVLAAVAVVLAGLAPAGCTSGEVKSAPPTGTPQPPLVTASSPSAKPAPAKLPQLSAAQVTAALREAGHRCTNEAPYMICAAGGVEVWLLTGTNKRVPVISLHAKGPVATAHKAIGTPLVETLATAHVNERQAISEWYAGLATSTTASKTIGDWRVEYSAESGTDEPGVHLTLNDRHCKKNCRAE
jgi:hypothetical protein